MEHSRAARPRDSGDLQVTAVGDREIHAALRAKVLASPHEAGVLAREPVIVAHDLAATRVVGDAVAYVRHEDSDRYEVIGTDTEALALATPRLVRDLVRGRLERLGATLVHASAAVHDSRAVLALGPKGAGKTTTALLLTSGSEWSLLANDRVFALADGPCLRLWPWPAAAAVGLGLLDALDRFDTVRDHLDSGGSLHPTTDRRVLDAVAAGRRTALHDDQHRELKAQMWPDQLTTLLGATLARHAVAAGLLYPRVAADQPPSAHKVDRAPTDTDFFGGSTEDRYPDLLRIRPARSHGSDAPVRVRLEELPAAAATLSCDPDDDRTMLATTAAALAASDG